MRAGGTAICGEVGVFVAVWEGELRKPDLVCYGNEARLAITRKFHERGTKFSGAVGEAARSVATQQRLGR